MVRSLRTVISTSLPPGFSGSIGFTGSAGDVGFTGSQGIPGEFAALGYTGSQGATGTSVRIVGSLADQSLLPDPYGGDIGDGYLLEDTGHLWIWDGTAWNDIGRLTGEVGPSGFTGSRGLGIIDTELVNDELIITFEDSTQNNVGNIRGFVGSQGESTFTWGDTAPENPAIGDRWFDTVVGAVTVYVDDGDTQAWLEVAGSGFMGQTGYTGSGSGSGPKVSGIDYPGDATAADPTGGETLGIQGSGFESGAHVLLDDQAVGQVVFVSATRLEFVAPSKTAGTYAYLYVINPDGGVAIHVPGVQYSGAPSWSTPAAGNLGSVYETQSINQSFAASSDSSVTYSLASGTLPAGSTLDPATGVLSGTAGLINDATTYTFTIRATDAESQTADRQFSLTIDPDTMTWSFPSEGAVIEIPQDEASTTTFSASAATGNAVTYSVSALPDGLTLSGDTVSGTATTLGDTAATATATATAAAASVSLTWRVVLGGDLYFNQTTLLLNADNNTFITDASTNNFTITPQGDTRPSAFSPYNTAWSNYFDGSGDYLNTPSSGQFAPTGDFTVAWWYYPINLQTTVCVANYTGALATDWSFETNSSGDFRVYLDSGYRIIGSSVIKLNQWHYLVVSRSGSTVTAYCNGSSVGTYTLSGTFGSASKSIRIGAGSAGTNNMYGYCADVNLIDGIALDGTVPTAPFVADANTSLLTCQSNRLIDNSTNNFTLTRNGDVKVTAFAPFVDTDTSTGSGYFDGTGDYLTVPDNAAFDLPGDFAIECWVYLTGTGQQHMYEGRVGSTTNALLFYLNSSTQPTIYINGSVVLTSSTSLVTGQWYYLVASRVSGTLYLFINGASAATPVANSVSITSPGAIHIGTNDIANGSYLTGYLSGLRVLKGSGYSSVTVPTGPVEPIAGTSLLTLQNRISYNNSQPIDESGIKNIITRNGNASAGTFSPHVPTGWSAYFDGTGDRLSNTTNGIIDFGTSPFTVEMWVYITTTNNQMFLEGPSDSGFQLFLESGVLKSGTSGSASPVTYTVPTSFYNAWNHIAVVREGTGTNEYSLYVNGTRQSQGTLTANFTTTGFQVARTSGYTFFGYMSNLRIIKGTAVYTSNFTPPTGPLEPIAGTSLLTLRGPSFTDDGPGRFAITRNGDTRITAFSPFKPHTIVPDSHSVYFDGTGDYVRFPTNADYAFGTGDFTIELWFYLTADLGDSNNSLIANDTTPGWQIGKDVGNTFCFMPDGSLERLPTPTINLHQWYHITYCRENGVLYGFLDGQTLGTVAMTTNFTNQVIDIGVNRGGTDYVTGHISNVRLIKGRALYTDQNGFTPSTTPLIPTNDTVLLTLREGSFFDSSKNRAVPTVNGNSQPTQFNPFGETVSEGVEYAPASHGGSVYFDGTGDYLSLPGATSFTLPSTMNWTVECWIYPEWTPSSDYRAIFSTQSASGTSSQLLWATYGTEPVYLSVLSGGGGVGSLNLAPPNNVIRMRQWQHIALVNNGGTLRQYHNGVLLGSGTAGNFTSPTTVTIGSAGTGAYFAGYIAGFNVLNGTALYTSAFVPPAAPATPIAGTTLLVNGTNAAIQDKTGRNVLETVGNARVLNGVRKFGSGAMYFDGTGDWVVVRNSDILSGDFTIEFWINYTTTSSSAPNSRAFCTTTTGNVADNLQVILGTTSEGSGIAVFSNVVIHNFSTAKNDGNWHHVAISRESGQSRFFIDGALEGSAVSTSQSFTLTNSLIGTRDQSSGNSNFTGYIDDLRITRGVARYTATFTPPTSTFKLR